MHIHNEIIELHPSVAKWLRDNNFIYDYEVWLNKHNRIDFTAHRSIHKGLLTVCESLYIEVGNSYTDELELIDKIIQVERYHVLMDSDAEIVLALPEDYHKHDTLLEHLCKIYSIKILRITPSDIETDYFEWWKSVGGDTNPEYFDYPNSNAFAKFDKVKRGVPRTYYHDD